MSDAVKETSCTRCVHRTVCKHKDDFMKVIQAINEASVHERIEDNKMKMTKVVNYECVGDITVTCRFQQQKAVAFRNGTL